MGVFRPLHTQEATVNGEAITVSRGVGSVDTVIDTPTAHLSLKGDNGYTSNHGYSALTP